MNVQKIYKQYDKSQVWKGTAKNQSTAKLKSNNNEDDDDDDDGNGEDNNNYINKISGGGSGDNGENEIK